MRSSWNKGLTKNSSTSVKKISDTMRKRKIDNFKKWRESAKRKGIIGIKHNTLKRDGNLAELLGVILGDGHIYKHDRCESLRITGNYAGIGFTKRYALLVEKIFCKQPAVAKVKATNAVIITLYEKNISKRLGIPSGSRKTLLYRLPKWIKKRRQFRIRFLRGLYEAEGSISHHEKTYTHKLHFSNANTSLLDLVFSLVTELGFHPHRTSTSVQLSRKAEVQNLQNLLHYRHYE